MTDETTLLPCPFCGGKQTYRKHDGGVWLTTTNHKRGCIMRDALSFVAFDTEAEAIEAWNARVYLNPDGLPNGLTISNDGTLLNWRGENYVRQDTLGSGTCENVSDPPSGFLCSECGWGDFAEPSHLLTTAKFTGRDKGPNYCPNCGAKVVGE